MGTLNWKGWRNWLAAMSLAGIQNHPVTFLAKTAIPAQGGEWVRWFCRTVDSWKSTVLNPDLKRQRGRTTPSLF